MADDANDVLDRLAGCRTPLLIGVRHHSAALARVMPRLLDDFKPKTILLEMPPDFEPWLKYLGGPDLESPVALAACDESRLLSFYPLADFSPELAAIRWAAANQVPVVPCDLDLTTMSMVESLPAEADSGSGPGPNSSPKSDSDSTPNSNSHPDQNPLVKSLLDRFGSRDTGDLWETLVETPAVDSSSEAIRRAALLFGWLIRHASNGPTAADVHREAAMRAAIAEEPKRPVAIVGSFHAAALLPDPILWSPPEPVENQTASNPKAKKQKGAKRKTKKPTTEPPTTEPPTTSLVSYSFAQLDQRSGYPAGVMDPVWRQAMLAADGSEEVNRRVADLAVALCCRLRDDGHVACTPDATEIVRLARDLSRLRDQPAPGRNEFLESIETALVQGDLFGRGRAVAAAAQAVLVGKRRGRLPKGVPRSGLAVQVEATVQRLKLPGPDSVDDEPREMRLDPLRSRLDRARAVVFRRLDLIGVHYAQRIDTETTGNRENLTEAWQVQWTHATTATVEAAGIHGVTLVQAAAAAVGRLRHPDAADSEEDDRDSRHPATTLARLVAAAECGLAPLVKRLLAQVGGSFPRTASTTNLIAAAATIGRISAGHVAGLPMREDDTARPDVERLDARPELLDARPLVEAALRGFEGLRGSEDPADVVALVDLTAMIRGDSNNESISDPNSDEQSAENLSSLLPALKSRLVRLRHDGSPRMQGAAWGALAMIDAIDTERLGTTLAGWYDGASTSEGRKHLRSRLGGLLVPLLPLVSSDPDWLKGLEQRMARSLDDEFLARLPALRGGFQSLTPADRVRLLGDRLVMHEPNGPAAAGARSIATRSLDDPLMLAAATAADRKGRSAIARLLPDFTLREIGKSDAHAIPTPIGEPPGELTLAERWRLVLGIKGCNTPKGRRVASTLDQLYGTGTRPGRGQQEDLAGSGSGGGTEPASPSPRQWIKDLDGLFGKDVCEEVIGEAAANGRAAMIEHLNPDSVHPSIELLEQVLSLRGALPERELGLLRKLARKITKRLADRLANRLRPALTGLSTARPTRRRGRRLDFARTLDTNLDTAHRKTDGRIAIAPRRLIFRTPARRQMDWHLIFVVDVSGSMEPSVIYSALVAAIFSSLPAIDVRFFAFSTEVLDFSDSVDDPLSLLMEVQVGGGTHIGLGLRAAREAVKNPSRTLVVLVTDFEEGVSMPEMLAEVRMLADSGAKLLGLAALDDDAKPRYHTGNAAAVATAGMPVAAVSPERLAGWVGDQIRGGRS